MYYILTMIFCIVTIIILKIGFNVKLKEVKKMNSYGFNQELKEIADKFPENKEICEEILKKLNNKSVKIEENSETKASLYIAVTNKIIIANIKNTFTRIQTIAHECLHSIQNRKILLFNFIFSNIYFLYFLIAFILILLNIGKEYFGLYIQIFSLLTLIYIGVRAYLENEAMSKAIYVAKDYMENYKGNSKINSDDITKLLKGFEYINKTGIPFTNFYLISINLVKIILLCIIALL